MCQVGGQDAALLAAGAAGEVGRLVEGALDEVVLSERTEVLAAVVMMVLDDLRPFLRHMSRLLIFLLAGALLSGGALSFHCQFLFLDLSE